MSTVRLVTLPSDSSNINLGFEISYVWKGRVVDFGRVLESLLYMSGRFHATHDKMFDIRFLKTLHVFCAHSPTSLFFLTSPSLIFYFFSTTSLLFLYFNAA